jgi:sigma-B regulation protein RsbU (phosphoserine phosphatase)
MSLHTEFRSLATD